MALLAASWLLVESFIIPHGFLKWFYLSFYIHPFFLVFCQVFLWLNQLMKLLIFLFDPLIDVFRLALFVFGLIERVVVFLFSLIRPTKSDVFYDALEPHMSSADCANIVVSCKNSTHFVSNRDSKFYTNLDATHESVEEINLDSCVQDSWLHEYLYSDYYTSSMSENVSSSESGAASTSSFRLSFVDQSPDLRSSHDHDHDHDPLLLTISPNDSVSPVSSSDFDDTLSPSDEFILDQGCDGLPLIHQSTMIDQFQHEYTSRMKFFDILYQERLHGINAISNELLSSSPSLFDCIEATDCPVQYKTWSRVARKRMMRSLECDLEMISVAQTCLFWEALDHQFHRVESLMLSDNNSGKILLFQHDISGRFQEVQIQLERFVEDERCGGQESSRNNTSKRLSFQGLLLVPDVTGFVVMEEENQMMSQEYCIRPSQLLEAIDICIKAFWSYIKTDEKKSFWKYKGVWRTHPPVEDPQDLELLYDVVKKLDKKWLTLRGAQGKSKCWLRRKVKPVQAEDEKRNLVFGMIDLNLVQRVLKMSLISKSHLKWCRQRLENLDFIEDRVVRGRITHMFPSS